jgi:uncharacterized YceG family protein
VTDRWFQDMPPYDPDDPEAVERELRRQERLKQRSGGRRPRSSGRRGGSRSSIGGGSGPGGAGRGLLYAAMAGGGLVVVLGLVFLFALFQPFAGEADGEPISLKVPAGASVGEIGDLLAEEGVISNATLFEIRARLTGRADELYFGDHTFYPGMSYSAALDELGNQPLKETLAIVIPEGLSRSETAETVEAAGLPGDYMKATISSPQLDPDDYGAQGRAENLEGFLFPATYELNPNSDVTDLVEQQLQAFKDNIAGVDMSYAKSKNLNIYDVVTIASMVEREVSVARERPIVAAVIYNRLSRGEPLFIDATTRFALDNWTEPLTESDLAVDSPYNTRTNAGLPPGPIGSPGLASIEAAAKPADTDVWLYVVKPGTCGEHVFSSSLDEHNANVARYQEAQAAAGGSPTDCG